GRRLGGPLRDRRRLGLCLRGHPRLLAARCWTRGWRCRGPFLATGLGGGRNWCPRGRRFSGGGGYSQSFPAGAIHGEWRRAPTLALGINEHAVLDADDLDDLSAAVS